MGATNFGVQYALDQTGAHNFVLLLNDDITLGPDFLEIILQLFMHHSGALIGSVGLSDED